MIPIPERSRTIIKNFLGSKEWEMITQIMANIIADIQAQPKVAETEWETLKNTVDAEGQAKGLTRLAQELHKIAQQAKWANSKS